ncbi:FAD:protein FMN transferase [Neptunicella sp. SCSIO 80796]|uniref:FAD:protein FMN transferase n=1 Tax=Neptunicella plasticusilytica TaxID=3117012 RepID=UPI003A4D3013
MKHPISITSSNDYIGGRFTAMASPCEVLVDGADIKLATQLIHQAYQETKRIEHKYSRYQPDNLVHRINHAEGSGVDIDAETFKLLNFANTCFELSQGLFDITSGVLRRAWRFDGSDNLPSESLVNSLRDLIGWQHVRFNSRTITLPYGFELDFGGIGKEYAVDAVARLCQQAAPDVSVLVNFGGDVQITRARSNGQSWQIGIEHPGIEDHPHKILQLNQGGVATSGDARRYLLKDGVRYSHILDPKTGYPVANAPRSVTVVSQHCVQAGLLSTMALLQGSEAESFLQQQNVQYWCIR